MSMISISKNFESEISLQYYFRMIFERKFGSQAVSSVPKMWRMNRMGRIETQDVAFLAERKAKAAKGGSRNRFSSTNSISTRADTVVSDES